jgi:RimJ/RimL family protein N-acetyltransferase
MADASAGTGFVTLMDGTQVPYRPITPADRQALQRFHDSLSDRSIYLRFMGTMPRLSDTMAHFFTNVDGRARVALVALDPAAPETIIGVVRYDRDSGTTKAEYAAVVTDRWQGRGLGLELTRRLIDVARERGVRTLYALVLPDNLRMLNLLRDLDLPDRTRFVDDIERVEVELFPEN